MYLDILAFDNHLLVNKTAIKLFGLETAVYCSVLVNIIRKVIKKNTADSQNFFIVDRDFIEAETGLSLEKQYNCDSILVRTGIINVDSNNRNRMQAALEQLTAVLANEDPKLLKDIAKKVVLPKGVLDKDAKAAKRAEEAAAKEEAKAKALEGKKATMKRIVSQQSLATTSPDLLPSLYQWVDSVYDSERGNNFLNKERIALFCSGIEAFSNEASVRQDLVNIAIARSYYDLTWVTKIYEDRYSSCNKTNATKPVVTQKIATEVNNKITF